VFRRNFQKNKNKNQTCKKRKKKVFSFFSPFILGRCFGGRREMVQTGCAAVSVWWETGGCDRLRV